MKRGQRWITVDGQVFEDHDEALQHEQELEYDKAPLIHDQREVYFFTARRWILENSALIINILNGHSPYGE